MHHVPVHIGQTEVAAFVTESELFVVHAEEVQDSGVEVMHVNLLLDRVLAEFVGFTINQSGPYSSSG